MSNTEVEEKQGITDDARQETVSQPPSSSKPDMPKKKKMSDRKKKRLRTLIIALAIILIAGGGIAFGVIKLFFTEPPVYPATGVVYRGSLMNSIQGYGIVKPVDSADIAVKQNGTVLETYVEENDMVMAGDKLFLLDGEAIDKAISDLEDEIAAIEKEITETGKEIDTLEGDTGKLQEEKNLTVEGTTVKAPFSGKLIDAVKHKLGDEMRPNDALGLLVDDGVMKLTLYFSYAYENDIKEGMKADVSIPGSMTILEGTVSEVEKIRRVTPQGTVLFEVTISVINPGALTKDMDATATLYSSSGEMMLPADAGKLEYNEEETLFLTTGGRLAEYNIRNYYEYEAGTVLARVEYVEDNSKLEANLKLIESKKEQINTKLKAIEQKRTDIGKQEALYDELLTVSPIDGTVKYCKLTQGEKVAPGVAVVSIVNMQTMIVEAQIDERDVSSVYPGMIVNLEQYTNEGVVYSTGTLTSVSMEGKNEWGTTYFPAIIAIENFSGKLMENMGMNFTANTDERSDILIAPVDAVKNTSLGNMVFIRADSPPPGALAKEEIPDSILLPDGFYAVPVVCGMGNAQGIEIVEGVEDGAELYLQDLDYDPNAVDGEGMKSIGGASIRIGRG